jgi:hypothetical protein
MEKIFFTCLSMAVILMSPTVFADTLVNAGGTAGNWQTGISPNGSQQRRHPA